MEDIDQMQASVDKMCEVMARSDVQEDEFDHHVHLLMSQADAFNR